MRGIEALRGIAATAVILSHVARHVDKNFSAPWLITLFESGHAGVDLFFVLSGFIILYVHRPDIGRSGQLGRYASRRFQRVLPLYWLALASTILLSVPGHGLPSIGDITWSALLLPSYQEPLLGIAWTLQMELAFYTIFGLLIVSRWLGVLAFALWAIVAGSHSIGGAPPLVPVFASSYALEFALGMASAVLVQKRLVPAGRWTACAGAATFAAFMVIESQGGMAGHSSPWARLAYGGAAAAIVCGVATCDREGSSGWSRLFTHLGTASYSLYLWQFVFIGIGWKACLASGLAAKAPVGGLFVGLSAFAIAGGYAVNLLVEKPLLRWMRKAAVSLPPSPSAAAIRT